MSAPGRTLFQAYAAAMSRHALQLIAEGYARMDHTRFADEEETTITGELVARIRAFLESDVGTPAWCGRYSVPEEQPMNVQGKLGKSRPRVDIEFECVVRGKRPRLRFEAKRLNSATGHTVAKYLGEEGLGCFLSGKYPMTHAEAGMLGYVQSEDEPTWSARIASALCQHRTQYAAADPPFSMQTARVGSAHTYISHHDSKAAPHTTVHHVFIQFPHANKN